MRPWLVAAFITGIAPAAISSAAVTLYPEVRGAFLVGPALVTSYCLIMAFRSRDDV